MFLKLIYRSRIAVLALLAAGLLQGCGKSDTAGTSGGSTPAGGSASVPAPAPLAEVKLGYFPNLTHAQAVLGVASGDFQSALGQTKLSTKTFNAGPELIQALNAHEIDIGYVGPGPAISAHVAGHGEAIRVISGAAANGVVIVARKDSGITTLKDLAGKKIATPQLYNTQDISAKHYVTAILGQSDASNVTAVPNSQQAGMMTRGNIDAAWVPEPWGARLISETGAILVGEEKDTWPGKEFALTVIVTSPEFLAQHPDVIEKILGVHHQWTQKLRDNPKAYAEQLNTALAAIAGKKLPADVMEGALARTEFTDDPLPDTFKSMAQWSADLKVVKQTPDLTGLFATDIIQKIGATTRP